MPEDRYLLTTGAVEKLRDTVRAVESMYPSDMGVTRLTHCEPAEAAPIRIGSIGTAAWSAGSNATVTLTNVAVTGYTVAVTNVFGGIPAGAGTQSVAVAKDGTAWYLIQGPGNMVLGQTTSTWAKGGTHSVVIYKPDASASTGTNITAVNKFALIGSGKWVMLGRVGQQDNWYVISAECG